MSSPTNLHPVGTHFGLKQGYYLVCPVNGVWSIKRRTYLRPKVGKNGYISLTLTLEKPNHSGRKIVTLLAHVVVKETFDGPTPQGMVIDHINRKRDDHRLENLRFASRSENALNANTSNYGNGRQRPVAQYTLSNDFVSYSGSPVSQLWG
jgi:hypothetical protein